MDISETDPSMLIGFLFDTRASYDDFVKRTGEVMTKKAPIYALQNVTPAYLREQEEELYGGSSSRSASLAADELVESVVAESKRSGVLRRSVEFEDVL
jgi:hypothetical protein